MSLDVDRVALQRAGKLDAAARHVGVRGLGLQHGVGRNGLGRFCDLPVVGRHETRRDGGLRTRAALEQATLDQQDIGAFAGRGHGSIFA